MQVDITFEFAKVYNFDKADVVKGQKFTLTTDFENGRYFSDNDEVLSLSVAGNQVAGTADATGVATILIMDQAFAIQKTLTINVVDTLQEKAATLGAEAGEPIVK